MTAERMFKEYKNLKKEQGILLFQLEQFSGIEESDVIDSMMFGHADDRVVWIDMVVGIISADECQTLETGAEAYRGYTSSDYKGNTR